MCTTTNCENGFVSETKSHAPVGEKNTLSGGEPGSQPAKMAATSGASVLDSPPPWRQRHSNDAEKAVFKKKKNKTKQKMAEMLFSFLANISEALCWSINSGSLKRDHVC